LFADLPSVLLAAWPFHAVPDGAPFAPHHIYIGVSLLTLAAWRVGDDEADREPVATVTATLGIVFGFALTWPFYAVPGAALTLAFATIATVAPLVAPFWREYPVVGVRGVAVLGGAVSLDDAVQHAFGVLTPGEWVWVAVIHPLIT